MGLLARARLWARFFGQISYRRELGLIVDAFRRRRSFFLPQDIWTQVDSCDGFLSRKEAGLLYWAACELKIPGPVIELGSFEGRSTIVFARAGRPVQAIDAWSLEVADLSAFGGGKNSADDSFARFRSNLRRAHVEWQITIHRGLTHDVGQSWIDPGAILFVDAGHTYADVRGDLDLWTPHLLPGGLLLIHDVLGDVYLDVTRAASELLEQNWNVVASAGSIVAFSRK